MYILKTPSGYDDCLPVTVNNLSINAAALSTLCTSIIQHCLYVRGTAGLCMAPGAASAHYMQIAGTYNR